jgi:hypothetical protein
MALRISGSCHYHPMRPGIGVCVECRQVVCAECSTQFEGINRCAACLAKMSRKADAASRGSDWRAGSFVTLLLVFGLLFGGVAWLASLIAP